MYTNLFLQVLYSTLSMGLHDSFLPSFCIFPELEQKLWNTGQHFKHFKTAPLTSPSSPSKTDTHFLRCKQFDQVSFYVNSDWCQFHLCVIQLNIS